MTTHRFVHLGDLHLRPGSGNKDRLVALDQVIAAGEAHGNLAAWLWPGDLNDARMSIEDRNALVPRVVRMANRAPVVVVYGNHDLPGDLNFLDRLKTEWGIFVVSKPDVVSFHTAPAGRGTTAQDEITLFCLPYPSKAGLVSAGVAHDRLHQAAVDALDLIFMEAGAKLEQARQAGHIVMAIGHANITGAISSVGQPQVGQELEVTPAHLTRLGECYIGFNHIHKAQTVADFNAHYPGSLCRLDWGECEPKGFLEVTYGPHAWRGHGGDGPWASAGPHWVYDLRQVPLDVPPMYHVEGLLSRDGFEWRCTKGPEGAEQEPPRSECKACSGTGDGKRDPVEGTLPCEVCQGSGLVVNWSGCDVRVRMRYPSEERGVLERAKARAADVFAGARKLEIEPIAVSSRTVRAPEVVQATTIEDKLAAWARLTGVTWSDQIQRCAARLLAVEDGDVLVTEVDACLSPLADLADHGAAARYCLTFAPETVSVGWKVEEIEVVAPEPLSAGVKLGSLF